MRRSRLPPPEAIVPSTSASDAFWPQSWDLLLIHCIILIRPSPAQQLVHIDVLITGAPTMSSRSGTPSTSRNPLESLVTSLVPSLAPPRDASSRTTSRAGHRTDSAAAPSPDAERRRREKVKALVGTCEGILARCVPGSVRADERVAG